MKFMNTIIKFYQRKINNVFFDLNESAEPGGIVFLGDSITDFFRVNEFFHGAYVINRGISGDTTDGVLKRLPESVFDLSPSKVFILIGTNDLVEKKTEQYIINNIEKIITAIQKRCPQTKLYLESIYPVSSSKNKKIKRFIVSRRNNEIISHINEGLENMAKKRAIRYIDVYSHLLDEAGNIRLEYTVEGLHLTVRGYRVVADVLMKYVLDRE